MTGALAVLVIGTILGLLGRLAMPGRHGLVRVALRDAKLAPRLLVRDIETRWEVGAGIIGGCVGYALGLLYDAQTQLGTTPMRWTLCVLVALVFVAISIASGVIERSDVTRRVGVHRWAGRGVGR